MPGIKIVIWSVQKTRIPTEIFMMTSFLLLASICIDKLYLGSHYMAIHPELCNIVLTKIIRYYKGATIQKMLF